MEANLFKHFYQREQEWTESSQRRGEITECPPQHRSEDWPPIESMEKNNTILISAILKHEDRKDLSYYPPNLLPHVLQYLINQDLGVVIQGSPLALVTTMVQFLHVIDAFHPLQPSSKRAELLILLILKPLHSEERGFVAR